VFFGTYRATRSHFACWWAGVVAGSAIGTGLYVLGGASESTLAAALGNGVSVLSAALAWLAARSLRGLAPRWWLPIGVAGVSALATWWERPEGGSWPGGLSLLVGMGVMLGLAARELFAVYQANAQRVDRRHDGEARTAIASLAIASALAAVFYAVRIATYLAVGPDAEFYVRWVGPRTTTFLVLLLLVVVSYTVTALSHYEEQRGWRIRALTDDLTGLMNRSAFIDHVREVMQTRGGEKVGHAVIVADIDHFKSVNDLHGHPYGDRVLTSFAKALRSTLGEHDLAARFGGEEFVLFIADADVDTALAATVAINGAFESTAEPDRELPTVSYGVASLVEGMTLESAIQLADGALYRAKRAGRAQAAAHGHGGNLDDDGSGGSGDRTSRNAPTDCA